MMSMDLFFKFADCDGDDDGKECCRKCCDACKTDKAENVREVTMDKGF